MSPKQKQKQVNISPIKDRKECAVICVEYEDGTWHAIRSDEYADFHMILAFGETLSLKAATLLFPDVAAKGLTYKP